MNKKASVTTDKPEQIDWHSGFAGALSLSLRNYRANIAIEREHYLTKEPPRIDFIVIKKNTETVINNSVGHLFRTHNIIEFKNPQDELNIDVVWKVIGYAGLYKGLSERVNAVPAEELTISIFRNAYPRKLFDNLRRSGKRVNNVASGVYYVEGLVDLPLQIVIPSELADAEFLTMRIMMASADENDVREFLTQASRITDAGDRQDADAILQVSASANKELYARLREEKAMSDALKEIMQNEFREAERRGEEEGRKEGRREGRREGRKEGREEGRDSVLDFFSSLSSEERQRLVNNPTMLAGMLS